MIGRKLLETLCADYLLFVARRQFEGFLIETFMLGLCLITLHFSDTCLSMAYYVLTSIGESECRKRLQKNHTLLTKCSYTLI